MITMSTPYEEMWRVFWYEYDKNEYWVKKYIKKEGKDNMMRKFEEAKLNQKSGGDRLMCRVDYKGKSGNRWVNFLYAHCAVGKMGGIMYDSVCYWETYGSFGTFVPFNFDGKRHLMVFSSHFWQRVCERDSEMSMAGVKTAMDFLEKHRAVRQEFLPPYEGDTRRRVALHWHCGSAYGVEVCTEPSVFEMRTYLDKASMKGHKLKEREERMEGMMSDELADGMMQIRSMEEAYPDAPVAEMVQFVDEDKRGAVVNELCDGAEKHMDEFFEKYEAEGLSEEDIILKFMSEQPMYVWKNGKPVKLEPIEQWTMLGLRKSKCKKMIEPNFEKLLKEVYKGDEPNCNVEALRIYYGNGFEWGWSATQTWFGEEAVPNQFMCVEYNTYKHGVFVRFMENFKKLEKRIKKENGEDYYMAVKVAMAKGFDDGVRESVEVMRKMGKSGLERF